MDKIIIEIKSIIDNSSIVNYKDLKNELNTYMNSKIKQQHTYKRKKKQIKIIRPPLFISESSNDSD